MKNDKINLNTMTKGKLAKAVAETTKHSQVVVENILEELVKRVISSLASGRRVELRGFGIWEVRMAKARVGRNPKNPGAGEVKIPPRRVVRFILGKDLRAVSRAIVSAPAAESAFNNICVAKGGG